MMHLPTAKSARVLRILVADDNAINTRTAARILRERGHGGALVNVGEQALKALSQKTFDLVLLDVNMPVMDGSAALKALRQRESAGATRTAVVFVTAHDLPSDRTRHMALGADGFLVKPLDAAALQTELGRLGLT